MTSLAPQQPTEEVSNTSSSSEKLFKVVVRLSEHVSYASTDVAATAHTTSPTNNISLVLPPRSDTYSSIESEDSADGKGKVGNGFGGQGSLVLFPKRDAAYGTPSVYTFDSIVPYSEDPKMSYGWLWKTIGPFVGDVFTPSIHPDSEAQSSTPNLKATLLLFGATGSGKTHTLRQVLPGIIDQIFSSSHLPIDPQEGHDNVAHPWSGPRTGTRITGKISISAREFSDKTVIPLHSLSLDLLPVGMGKIAPDGGIDADETAAQTGRKKVVDFINKVDKMRKTSATARNDQSSRSMLEWTVTLESTSAPSEGEGGIRRSLYLFDIPGRELKSNKDSSWILRNYHLLEKAMTYRCYADELPDPLVNPPKQTTRGVKSKPTSRPQSVMSRASSRIPAASSLGVRKDDVRAHDAITAREKRQLMRDLGYTGRSAGSQSEFAGLRTYLSGLSQSEMSLTICCIRPGVETSTIRATLEMATLFTRLRLDERAREKLIAQMADEAIQTTVGGNGRVGLHKAKSMPVLPRPTVGENGHTSAVGTRPTGNRPDPSKFPLPPSPTTTTPIATLTPTPGHGLAAETHPFPGLGARGMSEQPPLRLSETIETCLLILGSVALAVVPPRLLRQLWDAMGVEQGPMEAMLRESTDLGRYSGPAREACEELRGYLDELEREARLYGEAMRAEGW